MAEQVLAVAESRFVARRLAVAAAAAAASVVAAVAAVGMMVDATADVVDQAVAGHAQQREDLALFVPPTLGQGVALRV